jgi:hypothetical protein
LNCGTIEMSGGEFDYIQYRLDDVAESIYAYIHSNKDITPTELGGTVGRFYSDDTIGRFIEGYMYVKLAALYMQRIDWLVSDDDGEESFHARLDEEMKVLLGELSEKFVELKHLKYWESKR